MTDNIIRITRHHSTTVKLRSGNKPEVTIPVGPIFDLDSVDQYDADELRGILNDSHVEYEPADSSAGAGSVGGQDALSAAHSKPDPRVSATVSDTAKAGPESDNRKDELQPNAYGGELEKDEGGKDTGNEEPADREELLALLDQNVPDLVESMKGRSPAELRTLRKAEQDGKSRKSALEAIDEALNPEGDE